MGRRAGLSLIAACIAAWSTPFSVRAAPADPCENLPLPVTSYLRANTSWVLVRVDDLSSDHQQLWTDTHPGACPGLASGDFEGRGRLSFALALLRRGGGREEQLVLLRQRAGRTVVTTIVPLYRGASPEVVWRAPPGRTRLSQTRTIAIKLDSIMFEALESAARQYYFVNSRLLKIQTSD